MARAQGMQGSRSGAAEARDSQARALAGARAGRSQTQPLSHYP
jgi:hypothetical protein